MKELNIEMDGTILKALSNAMFHVELENGIFNGTHFWKDESFILNFYQVIK